MEAVSPTIFFIDGSRHTGLQAQIRETIVSAILSGAILPGVRMPSTRGLAGYLQISRLTVTLAYQELVSQGYLGVRARSAYHVSATPPGNRPDERMTAGPDVAVDWSSKLQFGFDMTRTIRKPLDWRRYRYPFLYGQMDQSLFDLAAWRDCARRALSREDFVLMAGDFAAADDLELVNYIRSRTLPARGIRAEPDEILVTVGAQNALWIVSQLLLSPGSHAVFENPGHPDIGATLHLTGARVTALDVDAEGLPPEKLPDGIDAVFVTPSHQSPTAATMPRHRRVALLEAAAERDFVIVEDDYEFEMSFLQPPTPALKSLDRYGRVLYAGSFSKSLFPGLRLGYLVAPAPVIREARALRALMLRHPPGHLQRTAAYFLALGHYDAVIHRMRLEYHKRHMAMIEALDREGLEIAGKSAFGGTAFWIRGPEGTDADELARRLRDDGVLIESGSPFFSGHEPCRYFRMAYSSIPLGRIAEGVALVARALPARARGGS